MTWARVVIPTWMTSLFTCVSTVRLLKTNSMAISPFNLPCANNWQLRAHLVPVGASSIDEQCYASLTVLLAADKRSYSFVLQEGGSPKLTSTVGGRGGICILTDSPIPLTYIRAEGVAGRMGQRLMAAVVDTPSGKAYVAASEMEELDFSAIEPTAPDADILHWAGCTNVVVYGMKTFQSLFNVRQQLALSTFGALVVEARDVIKRDAIKAGLKDDGLGLEQGGLGATAYAEAVSVYLTCGIGRAADYWNTLTSWESGGEFVAHAFTKHALPIVWDYGEINPLTDGGGSWVSALGWIARVIDLLPAYRTGHAMQIDAAKVRRPNESQTVVSTDPPYYDNVPYSNLSDFFYIWMRPCLRQVFPDIFATRQTPKADELVASHSFYEDIDDAMRHFTGGMTRRYAKCMPSPTSRPVTIYYAFKQSDTAGKRDRLLWVGELPGISDQGRVRHYRDVAGAN